MPNILGLIGLLIIVLGHTVLAAVVTRLFRVRLSSRLGPLLYTAVLTPLVLLLSTLLFTGVLGIGVDVGDAGTALFLLVLGPLVIGVTLDYIWMPAPDEVEVPETA